MLIRVAACGICATDLHLLDGSIPLYKPPRVLGHEMSGTVVAVGPDARSVEVGAAVAIDPNISCGSCFYCQEALPYMCPRRTSHDRRLRRVPPRAGADRLSRCPAGIPVEYGAIAEPLSCCLRATERADLRAGGTVAIVGAGTIGLLITQLAKRSGAALVAVSEPDADRRALALKLGADLAIDPTSEDPRERLLKETRGIGVDVAFEAVGAVVTAQTAISLPRRSGTVVLIGVPPATAELTLKSYELFERELTIRTSFIRAFEFRRAVELLAVLDVEPLLGTRFPLDRIHDAFAAAGSRQGVKTLVTP